MSHRQHVIVTPGSRAAVERGCLCARLDNAHGRGAYVDEAGAPVFWINEDCPVHHNIPAPLPNSAVDETLNPGGSHGG